MALALLRSDLSIRYVAEHTTTNLPRLYKAAALLAGKAGCSLSFALLVTACAAVASGPAARVPQRRGLWALALIVLGALAWSALGAPPFARVPWQLADGRGLDPALQNPLLFTQRPLILLGYALILVAAALALDESRRRSLSPWLFAVCVVQLAALLVGAAHWLSVAPLLVTAFALLSPSVRWQWLPTTRRGRAALTATVSLAVLFGGLAAVGPASGVNISLGQGESTKLRDAFNREWTLTQEGVSAFRSENWEVTAVTIAAMPESGARTLLVTERRQSVDSSGEEIAAALVVPGRAHGLAQEVHVRLERTLPDNAAELRVEFQAFKAGLSFAILLLFMTAIVLWIASIRRTA